MSVTAIDVCFDYNSPFAYFASEVLPAFAERNHIALRWKPIDSMALGNYAGGLPYSPVKRQYVMVDAVRTAEYHGIVIRIPMPHPVLSQAALRVATAAIADDRFAALHRALFRAAWRDQRDISTADVLAACIREAGGPVDEWMAAAETAEVADQLAARTRDSEARGVFGVPSMFVADELFWGVDSLPILQWRLDRLNGPGAAMASRSRVGVQ